MKNEALLRNFCRNIHYLRQSHRLTQAEMAAIIGISVSTLRKIEHGTPIPRIHSGMLHRVCDHFCISADVILYDDLEHLDP